jgi:hypothetical protein
VRDLLLRTWDKLDRSVRLILGEEPRPMLFPGFTTIEQDYTRRTSIEGPAWTAGTEKSPNQC